MRQRGSPQPIRLLTFTTLYPNERQPNHGIFVENRLRQLTGSGKATSVVLAPVTWLTRDVPAQERRHNLHIYHPRFPTIPRIGMRLLPHLLYATAAKTLGKLLDAGARFDAIDAHYFYPDGVAASWLGRRFDLPVVITARGSDITQFPSFAGPRRLILNAAADACAIITVSAGLREALIALGASPGKITVLRNGVDLATFSPRDRREVRSRYGVGGQVAVSVGALIERKGHHLTIEAIASLPGWTLLIAGDGPERSSLVRHARNCGVADRVRLLGAVPHTDLPNLFSAADVSVLSSSREGWANVLLESMACGTPVVASPIPGNPEVIQFRDAGLIAAERTPQAIAEAIASLSADPPRRESTRAYAERFDWDTTTRGQLAIFETVTREKVLF